MNFLELAKQRHAVRRFQPKQVEQEKIDQILVAAQVAPTAHNFQSERILILNSEEMLEKLKKCTPCHYNAPLAFLIGYDRNVCWKRENDGKASGEIDASIVGTHMMLEAYDIGIGSCWVMNFDSTKIREEFHVPEEIEIVALLVCGYEGDNPVISKRHTTYQSLESLSFYQFDE